MEPLFLLDTSIMIYIRQQRPGALLRRFQKLREGKAAISVITYGELIYGAQKSGQRAAATERLKEMVLLLPALPLPEAAAASYGKIRAELEAKGEMIGNNDLWIAAHALASDLVLVTNDEKEFKCVRGLKIQNWAA